MEPELPGIDVREKVLAEQRIQESRAKAKAEEQQNKRRAMFKNRLQQTLVAEAKFVEPALEGSLYRHQGPGPGSDILGVGMTMGVLLVVVIVLVKPHDHCRNQCAR